MFDVRFNKHIRKKHTKTQFGVSPKALCVGLRYLLVDSFIENNA